MAVRPSTGRRLIAVYLEYCSDQISNMEFRSKSVHLPSELSTSRLIKQLRGSGSSTRRKAVPDSNWASKRLLRVFGSIV